MADRRKPEDISQELMIEETWAATKRFLVMAETVQQMQRTLYGNGHHGLIHDFTVVKTQQDTCAARNRSWMAIGAIIIAAFACLANWRAVMKEPKPHQHTPAPQPHEQHASTSPE